jgi:hypothetical protein
LINDIHIYNAKQVGCKGNVEERNIMDVKIPNNRRCGGGMGGKTLIVDIYLKRYNGIRYNVL